MIGDRLVYCECYERKKPRVSKFPGDDVSYWKVVRDGKVVDTALTKAAYEARKMKEKANV